MSKPEPCYIPLGWNERLTAKDYRINLLSQRIRLEDTHNDHRALNDAIRITEKGSWSPPEQFFRWFHPEDRAAAAEMVSKRKVSIRCEARVNRRENYELYGFAEFDDGCEVPRRGDWDSRYGGRRPLNELLYVRDVGQISVGTQVEATEGHYRTNSSTDGVASDLICWLKATTNEAIADWSSVYTVELDFGIQLTTRPVAVGRERSILVDDFVVACFMT
tara:strand:+ start:1093 stop:1749 length:657 start_codon:yes stop_codon:yes gene_type:complete